VVRPDHGIVSEIPAAFLLRGHPHAM